MRLQQWSPNRTRNGITSEQKTTWFQGCTSKIIWTKSKSIRPNRNQLNSYVGPYRSLQWEQLEVFRTCRNDIGTSIIFITSTIPNLTGRSSAGAIFDEHNTIAPRAHQHAFPHLYSSEVCSRNRLVLTDEDTSQFKPFESLISTTNIFKLLKVMICTFHGIWMAFKKAIFLNYGKSKYAPIYGEIMFPICIRSMFI